MRDRTWQRRITIFLGVLLSFAVAAGSFVGFIQQSLITNSQQQQTQPTDTPAPTVPAPVTSFDDISFDTTYLHPSGLFTLDIPSGWQPQNNFSTTGEAQATLENPAQLSVMEVRVIRPTADQAIDSPDDLNGIFNENWLQQSWREYSSWDIDSRTVSEEDGTLTMDFSLVQRGQDYIARQIAFADETWVYTVRVVTPSNASEYLRYVLENAVDNFDPIDRYIGTRLEWDGYFDGQAQHLIRFPDTWNVTDSAPGAPASIVGNDVQLRVETTDTLIESEDAATTYVEGLQSGTTVTSVESIEQFGTTGYSVAYERSTLDGATNSGLVYLLQGSEQTHVANLLLTAANGVDLNNDEAAAAYEDTLNALNTFALFPELNVDFVGSTAQ